MRNLSTYVLIILFVGTNSLSQINFVHGCSFSTEVDNYITVFDLNGAKVQEKKLDYLGVGADCSITNSIFPSTSDGIYIQDEKNKVDFVDISNDKWEVETQYQIGNIYRPLNIYQNKVILNPKIDDLMNKIKFEIVLYDLLIQEETIIKFDLIQDISKTFNNFTIIHEQISVTSNNNWIAFFAQLQPNGCNNSCEEDVRYWLYRYNMQNSSNNTYKGTLSQVYDHGFGPLDQFQISRDGRFVFFVEDYPYNNYVSFDLDLNLSKEMTNKISIREKWIKEDSIYYINSENSIYSLYYLNLTNNVSETLIEFDNIYPNKIAVTDNYILIADTRPANNNFLAGNNTFFMIISTLFMILIIKRKLNLKTS